MFPRTIRWSKRWKVAASDLHKILDNLEGADRQEEVANAFWINFLTGGVPDLDFWLNDHLSLDIAILHRRVDYLSGCKCGKGLDKIDPDNVATERFNYLFEPGVTEPVTPFSFELKEVPDENRT